MKSIVTTDIIGRLRVFIIQERDSREFIDKLVTDIGYAITCDTDFAIISLSTRYTSEIMKKYREPLLKMQQVFSDYFALDNHMQLTFNLRFLKEAKSIVQEINEYNEMCRRTAFANPNFI